MGKNGERVKLKVVRGVHTGPNVWDRACVLDLGIKGLDPGVNYFVARLWQAGLSTVFSCEGHPDGFYVVFHGSMRQALRIKRCGFFSVEIVSEDLWDLRLHRSKSMRGHVDTLRWAADAWEDHLGPLQLDPPPKKRCAKQRAVAADHFCNVRSVREYIRQKSTEAFRKFEKVLKREGRA